ncbi:MULTISPECIES: hypothetical protein [unclassified Thomasclavelia]|uniref:hypothetical protein n=1 Tax=unclassified Thomasclavelia TaxID=3025756 RepID=UPI000B3A5AA2|nr:MULTISPECIES: hypothetical protein [unclassified Thomasclavelia]OUP78386.1 hypothetical protein B5F09_02920 [Erysipelatoclostridium sp. An173]
MGINLIIGIVIVVVLLIILIIFLRKRSHRPKYYVLLVSFDDGYYVDLSNDERFKKMARFEKDKDGFIAETNLNEVQLKKEIGHILEMDLAKIHVIVKRWWLNRNYDDFI